MATYPGWPLETDPTALAEEAFARLQARWPLWLPNSANFDTGTIEAHAQMLAELRDVAAVVPDEVFDQLGVLEGVPRVNAQSAAVTATVTAVDVAGYTLEAGTVVSIPVTGDVSAQFAVAVDVVIPPGSAASATGAVILVAQEPGADANSLGSVGSAASVTDRTLPWVASILLTGSTSGGTDEEDPLVYRDRLTSTLQLATARPVLAPDFADFARLDPDIDRAVAIDLYDANTDTSNVAGTVSVYVVGPDGLDPGTGPRTRVHDAIAAELQLGFVVRVVAPAYVTVKAAFTGVAYPGWDAADVQARAITALTDYLSPANWGIPPFSEERVWAADNVVRLTEVVEVLNRVDGFWRLTGPGANGLPQLALGAGTLASADVTLTGAKVVMPLPGVITGTVVAG